MAADAREQMRSASNNDRAMAETSDEELLRRVAKGDRTAFENLYDRYAPRLLGFASRLMGSVSEAEDVVQEAFLKVWRSASDHDPSRSPPAVWMFLIARSRALDALRRRRPAESSETLGEVACSDRSQLNVDQRDLSLRACQAMAELPIEQQEALALVFWNGCSHTEVAQRLDLPLGTAKTRIRLGVRRLRDQLVDSEDD